MGQKKQTDRHYSFIQWCRFILHFISSLRLMSLYEREFRSVSYSNGRGTQLISIKYHMLAVTVYRVYVNLNNLKITYNIMDES